MDYSSTSWKKNGNIGKWQMCDIVFFIFSRFYIFYTVIARRIFNLRIMSFYAQVTNINLELATFAYVLYLIFKKTSSTELRNH